MATDRDIEFFIGDSFTSVWDIELLTVLLASPDRRATPSDLIERMRASVVVASRSIGALTAAGIAVVDDAGCVHFRPVSAAVENNAVRACDFYSRFPGRVRRLIVARQTPGLTAFADAFRLRKD